MQCPPFSAHRDLLCHRTDYRATQRLGAALRAAAVDGFEFGSARDPEGGINVALFEPAALSSRRPLDPEPLLCETGASLVRFRGAPTSATDEFPLAPVLVDGELPQPAP